MLKNHWEEIQCGYVDEDSICHIDAWKEGNDQGAVIAWVDMLSGRAIYGDPLARVDALAQETIKKVSDEARKNHPYPQARLENLLRSIVGYECEGLCAGVDVEGNLCSMGFSKEEMIHFGFPPQMD